MSIPRTERLWRHWRLLGVRRVERRVWLNETECTCYFFMIDEIRHPSLGSALVGWDPHREHMAVERCPDPTDEDGSPHQSETNLWLLALAAHSLLGYGPRGDGL